MAFFESHPDRITVREADLAGTWHTLIPDAAGRGEDFFRAVEDALKELMPNMISMKRKEVVVVSGGARVCLLVERAGSMPEYHHRVYFTTQDFEKHLILSRVTVMNSRNASAHPPFGEEEVSAYLTLIDAATQAGKTHLLAGKQDMKMMNVKTGGVIDIT